MSQSALSVTANVADEFQSLEIYERKVTWQETLLASREKLISLIEEENRNLRGISLDGWRSTGAVKIRQFADVHYSNRSVKLKPKENAHPLEWREAPQLEDGRIHLLEKGRHCTFFRRNITVKNTALLDVYLGAADSAKVWLNGHLLLEKESFGYRRKYFEKISLPLTAGENQLLIAVFNNKDECGFYFSVKQDYAFRIWEQIEKDFPMQWDWAEQDGGEKLYTWLCGDVDAGFIKEMILHVLKEPGIKVSRFQAEFDRLAHSNIQSTDRDWLDLYVKICEERRASRLQPVLEKSPKLIFTKHYNIGGTHYAYTEAQSDAQRERYFHPGSSLCLLEMDGTRGKVSTLLEDPDGVIRDPDVSMDGKRILFSWKKSDREDDFHLYEMDVASRRIRQLTFGLGFADYEGAYLPNGDIVFNSTRCVQTVDCWWTEVSNLYTCDKDGRFLRRLAYDQVHSNFPTVTPDGRVLYTRWEYNDRGHGRVQPLFQMNPDGTGQTEFYGNNSWFPTSILHARGIPGTKKVLAIAGGHHARQSGKLILIDPAKGRQENDGVTLIAPPRETEAENIDAYGQYGEQFQYPYPINRDTFLVAYEPVGWTRAWYGREILFGSNIFFQSVKSGAILVNPPLLRFKIYAMAIDGRRELLMADPDISCNQPIPLAPRTVAVRPSVVDYRKKTGTFYLQDIYAGPGLKGIPRGTIKKLRVIRIDYRAAGIGGNSNRGPASGAIVSTPIGIANASWDVKAVLGDAKVYADGSACFTVPARTPVYFQALDGNGHAVQTMRSWSTLQPGETFSCIGCHEDKNQTPPSYSKASLALQTGPQPLIPFYGPTRGFSYLKEIQPILDRHCIRCHDDRSGLPQMMAEVNREPIPPEQPGKPDDPERAFSLLGTLNPEFKTGRKWCDSYLALTHSRPDPRKKRVLMGQWDHKLVNWVSPQSIPPMLPPYWKGAAKSELIPLLKKGHKDVKLSTEELDKIACWIDLLVPYCGDYTEANTWGDEGMAKYNNWIRDNPYTENDPAKRYQHFLDKRRRMEKIEQENIAALIAEK